MDLFTDLLKAGYSWAAIPGSKLSVDVSGKKDLTDFNLHATLQTQHEKLKNAELSLKNKVSSVSVIFYKTERKLNTSTYLYCITPAPFEDKSYETVC
jgi:hypothetical protein